MLKLLSLVLYFGGASEENISDLRGEKDLFLQCLETESWVEA